MKTKIQSQIINILGAIAILSLLEVLLIQLLVQEYDFTILTTLILIPSNVVAALGGFITGKASSVLEEKQNPINIGDEDVGDGEDGKSKNANPPDEKC